MTAARVSEYRVRRQSSAFSPDYRCMQRQFSVQCDVSSIQFTIFISINPNTPTAVQTRPQSRAVNRPSSPSLQPPSAGGRLELVGLSEARTTGFRGGGELQDRLAVPLISEDVVPPEPVPTSLCSLCTSSRRIFCWALQGGQFFNRPPPPRSRGDQAKVT